MKTTIVLTAVLALLLPHLLNAQPDVEWIRLYGDNQIDQFFAHVRTTDGGWAFAGRRGGRPCNNWLVVTDEEGEEELFEEYNIDNGQGQAMDLVQTEDNGYLLAGAIGYDDGVDPSAIRVDAFGDEMWGRLYGGGGSDHFRAVAATKNDQFILAGVSSSWVDTTEDGQLIAGGLCGYLVLIDGIGEVIWQDIYGGLDTDWLEDVIVVEGGYVAAGRSRSFGGEDNDLWLLRVDEDGNEIWSFGYGNEASEVGWAVVRTEEDNGYAIAGWEIVPDPENEGEYIDSPILLKVDENGEQEWFNRYPIEGLNVYIHDVVRTPDNGYALVGASFEDDPHEQLTYILCLDEDGNVMWGRSDGVVNGEYHQYNSAVLADDGGITAAGQAYGANLEGDYQGLFAKLEPANLPPIIMVRNPNDSIIFVHQNDERVFSVEARDPEGVDLSYLWTLDEEVVGEEEMVIVGFPELGDFNLRVDVTDDRWTASAGWLVHVFALVSGHTPVDTGLTVPVDTTVFFNVQTEVEIDSLTFQYTLDGESVGEESFIRITFDELGEHFVQADILGYGYCDSVVWRITVFDPDEVTDGITSPHSIAFHHSYPNPFNESAAICFNLPQPQYVRATVHDLTGKEVALLTERTLNAGQHSFSFGSANLSAGVYYYRISGKELSLTGKCVLVR